MNRQDSPSHDPDPESGVRPHVAIVGGGVIGSGWAARFVLNGIDVAIFDPNPDTPRIAGEVLANADRAFERLFGSERPPQGDLRIGKDLADTLTNAFFVQESVPERLDLKRRILADIDAIAPPQTLIASSTSGLLPSEMQKDLAHPQRLLVGHPFNPVYLLPLVELVAGQDTSPTSIESAHRLYASIGMKPVRVAKEIDAFIGDRLQEALWREALWLVRDGIASVEEIDDVIRYSFGLRWAQMGVFQTYRIAGGEAGMRHFLEQFGPALAWPWSRLVDVPDLDESLIETIAEQSNDQAAGLSIRELESIRDDNLIAIMQALEGGATENGWGAGESLAEFRKAMRAKMQSKIQANAQGRKTP
eukprot:XP_003390591.1 PREDICTED: uncharacterized protein LOC100640262 [Amphimedon queenslandica]